MKTPDEIKRGLECCNCDHYEVCQTHSHAGILHKVNASRCAMYSDRTHDRKRISVLEQVVDEQNAYIQQLEAQVPKWISVEERLPEAKLCVLGYGVRSRAYNEPDPFAGVHDVYTRGEDEGWFTYWNRESVDVTHWMPLPEPPKENT